MPLPLTTGLPETVSTPVKEGITPTLEVVISIKWVIHVSYDYS